MGAKRPTRRIERALNVAPQEVLMVTTTADLLLDYARRFRDRIDLSSVQSKLGSSDPTDQRQALLFSVYHLLFSGAVAEANIEHYLAQTSDDSVPLGVLPDPVQTRADEKDRWANFLGWKGTAFGDVHNIIGALAFSVVVLFFFEGFCKVALTESRLGAGKVSLADVLKWLRKDGKVSGAKLDTALFLNRYRNAWHSFGQYKGKKTTCKGVALKPGNPLPVLAPPTRDEMLADLLDLFLEVDATYHPL
jgi:hypothetical protein